VQRMLQFVGVTHKSFFIPKMTSYFSDLCKYSAFHTTALSQRKIRVRNAQLGTNYSISTKIYKENTVPKCDCVQGG
jgi:hypothetical protein